MTMEDPALVVEVGPQGTLVVVMKGVEVSRPTESLPQVTQPLMMSKLRGVVLIGHPSRPIAPQARLCGMDVGGQAAQGWVPQAPRPVTLPTRAR